MASVIQRKPKFKTEFAIAVDSFVTSALEGGPFPVAAYSRFRVSHPVVKAVPDLFIEDGADYSEIAAQRTRLWMEASPPPEPPAPVLPAERRLVDEDALVSKFNAERVRKGSPEVKLHPDWYVPVVPSGLSRRDALLVLAPMTLIGDGGKPTRIVHAGTWLHRDDPLVHLHPHNFQALMPDAASSRPAKTSTRTEA
jgi:hypothetical protein